MAAFTIHIFKWHVYGLVACIYKVLANAFDTLGCVTTVLTGITKPLVQETLGREVELIWLDFYLHIYV